MTEDRKTYPAKRDPDSRVIERTRTNVDGEPVTYYVRVDSCGPRQNPAQRDAEVTT